MKELAAAGVKVVTPAREVAGLFKIAFVEDPWGVKIEIVQDPETLGFHHVHLRGPDPNAILAWYQETFGGERTKLKGRLDAVKYGDVWVLAQQGDATPSAGHAIDHVGWRVTDLDSKLTELKAKGVKVTGEPRSLTLATGTVRFGFIEGPAATRIEVVQR
jgi:catechol 2,3-dioxygenase-like lactoylglutathione lyase family enzyme